MRSESTFACSSHPGGTRSRATRCRNTPTRSGTAICPMRRAGLLYGYRAYGPYAPEQGHRFNHHKLLLDPYARAARRHCALVRRALRLSSAFAARRPVIRPARQRAGDAERRGDRRLASTGATIVRPRAVVGHRDLRGACARADHAASTRSAVRARHLRGLAHPAVIDHLRRLGITAIELMPVHAFVQDRFLLQRGLRNYWGYNTLAFFAPEPSLSVGRLAERDARRGAPAARRRYRGDPRRGLQPHRRSRGDSGRRCRSAGSTMPATIGWRRTIRAATSTTPAPATRSTSRIRVCCRW